MAKVIQNLSALSGALEGLGTGLGVGLQDYAAKKFNQLQQREDRSRISNALSQLGFPQEQASGLSNLPSEYLSPLLKGYIDRGGLSALQQTSPSNNLSSVLSALKPQKQMDYEPQQDLLSRLGSLSNKRLMDEFRSNNTQQILGLPKQTELPSQEKSEPQQQFSEISLDPILERARQKGLTISPEIEQQLKREIEMVNGNPEIRRNLDPMWQKLTASQKPKTFADVLSQPTLKEQRQDLSASQKIINERHGPILQTLSTKGQESLNKLKIVRELDELNQSGELGSGAFGYGINEPSQLFQSLVARLVPVEKAKSKKALEELEKSYPSLSQPSSVRDRLIKNLKEEYLDDYLKSQIAEEIVSENNGNIPQGFNKQLQNRLMVGKKNIKQLGEDFSIPTQDTQSSNSKPSINQSPLRKLEKEQNPLTKASITKQGNVIPDNFQQFSEQLEKERKENPLSVSDVARGAAGLVGRAAEGAGKGVTGLVAAPFGIANLASGGRIPIPESIRALEELPTNIVRSVAGDIVNPKSEAEKQVGDFVSDVFSFLSPGGLLGTTGKGAAALGKGSKWLNTAANILKVSPTAAITTAGAGNAASWLGKEIGLGEKGQTIAKAGTMLAVPLIGSRRAGQLLTKLDNNIGKAITPNDVVKSEKLANRLSVFYNALNKGESTPLKQQLLSEIESMPSIKMPVQKLWSFEKDLINATNSKELTGNAQKLLPIVTEEVGKALKSVSSSNPALGEMISEYRDLSNALQQTNRVAQLYKNYLGPQTKNPSLTALLYTLGLTRRSLIPFGAAALVPGEIERVIQMSLKSSAFRNAYEDLLKAATLGNVSELNKSVIRLDKIMDKEMSNDTSLES